MAVEKVLEAAEQIRAILLPLTDFEQQAALEVARTLENHVRALEIVDQAQKLAVSDRSGPESEFSSAQA